MGLQKNEVRLFSSLKVKIIFLVFSAVLISTIFNLVVLVSISKKCMENSVKNNLFSLVLSYGNTLESNINDNKNVLDEKKISDYLENIDIKGTSTSYAYLVDTSSGNMIYHPESKKIGKPVANSIIKQAVSDIKHGKTVKSSMTTYIYGGQPKYAGYYVSKDAKYILVVTVDQKEILSPLNALYTKASISLVIILLIMGLVSFITSNEIAKPISKITNIIMQISNLDLKIDNAEMTSLINKHNEAGLMASAVFEMCKNIASIIKDIHKTCDNLNSNSNELNKICISVNDNSLHNSSLSEQLAANMQETTATTEVIASNINNINSKVDNINDLVHKVEATSESIREKAKKLKSSTSETTQKTNDLYSSVYSKASQAFEQSKVIEKIQILTDTIHDIADQTSLLSLNASIEAARAGDAGKSFSVVASQIGHLAQQSNDAVNNISNIVTEIHTSSDNMAECLKMLLNFINTNVIKDYKDFINIIEIYYTDASGFKDNMHLINNSINSLKDEVEQISSAINGINITISDSAMGITSMAEKITETSSLTEKTDTIANTNVSYSEILKKLVSNFKY